MGWPRVVAGIAARILSIVIEGAAMMAVYDYRCEQSVVVTSNLLKLGMELK